MKPGVLLPLVLVLAGALAVQLAPRPEFETGKGPHLRMALPQQISGWMGAEVPLGATEAASGAVEKALRFDDVYFREFRAGTRTLSLYVAYWGPGKMPTQLVASHTPDRCWVENGWSCEQVRHGVPISGQASTLRPGEWRVFSAPNGQKLTVVFWHRVGAELYDYGDRTNKIPSVWRWWRDAVAQSFRQPREQYFVRLASDQPFETLRNDPGWNELVAALGALKLRN